MTSIEQTRKEFFNGDFTLREIGLQTIAYQMGIKDAQKEFLEFLSKMKDELGQDWEESYEDKLKELKQSLEAKE